MFRALGLGFRVSGKRFGAIRFRVIIRFRV